MSEDFNCYHLWITMVDKNAETTIIHALVKNNYIVSNASENIAIHAEGNASSVIGIKIEKSNISYIDMYAEIQALFQTLRINYYSMILSKHSSEVIWCSSNYYSDTTVEDLSTNSKLN